MTTNFMNRPGISAADDEKARRAVKAFRGLQPTLTAYARALTGKKDVIVQMAATDNGSTDGKNIFFRPPIALGDGAPHDRSVCGERNRETGLLVCAACAVREEVLVTIYHEIGHIAFGTFSGVTDESKRSAIEWAIKESKGKYGEQIAAKIKAMPNNRLRWYGDLTAAINEYLPIIVNGLEDARVDAAMFQARPGLRKMFKADIDKGFREGIQVNTPDGPEFKAVKDAPLNSQAIIATYYLAAGHQVAEHFHPEVQVIFTDPRMAELVAGVTKYKTSAQTFGLSFHVLARLRELGFCGTPQDPDPEPTPEEQPQDETPAEDVEPEEGPEESEVPGEGDPSEPGDASEQGTPGESVDVPPEGERGEDGQVSGDASDEPGEAGGDDPSDADSSDEVEPNKGDASAQEDDGGPEAEEADASDGGQPCEADGESVPDGGQDDDGRGGSDAEDQSPGESESDEGDPAEGAGEPGRGDSGSEDDQGVPGHGAGDGEPAGESGLDDARDTDASDGSPEAGDGDQHDAGDGLYDGEDSGDSESEGSGSPSEADQLGHSSDEHGPDRDDAGASPAGDGGFDEPSTDDDAGSEAGRGEAAGEDADLSSDADGSREAVDSEEASASEGASTGDTEPELIEDGDAIDTGADDGYGGTEVDRDPTPEHGDFDDNAPILIAWNKHHDKPSSTQVAEQSGTEDDAVNRAIIQGIYFTHPSANVYGCNEYDYDDPNLPDSARAWRRDRRSSTGGVADLVVPEALLQPAVIRTRRAFSDNRRGSKQGNLRRGKVDARVLGGRAWSGDDRLFSKRTMPGQKDYEVIIGMDVSGSTVGVNLALEKRAIAAQAEMLHRVGVPFSIYGHTGAMSYDGPSRGLNLEVYRIKQVREPWNSKTRERLENISHASANLDGHALEYLRKRADESRATDKIILYYSDGKMPQENHDEELALLTGEIALCKRKGYTLLGVGIRTDSPRRHGLDTVQVDDDEDLIQVVRHLEKRISATR